MINKKNLVLLTASFLALAFVLLIKFYKSQETNRIAFIAQENFATLVPEYSPKLGTTSPKVYLVEFLDPECESCSYFYPMVKELLAEFEGKVQLVVRYAPFHGNSVFAVKILEASRKQGKYWETLESLFKHQSEWGSHHHPRPELIWTYLSEAGVDVDQIKNDMEDPTIMANLQTDIENGRVLGVKKTPQFFINGKPLERFGIEFLREEINNAL